MARKTKAEREVEEQRKRVVDEYGMLDGGLVRHKARRMDELGKIIRSWFADADPEAAVSSAGDEYEVFLSAACAPATRASFALRPAIRCPIRI